MSIDRIYAESATSPAASGDDVHAFVAANRDALVALAYVLTGSRDAAQEAAHDVIERMLARDLAGVRDLTAYARRAIANECTTRGRRLVRRRRRYKQLRAEWERTLSTQPDPFGRIEVLSALASLSDRQRTAVVLRYYVSLPDAEIAEILDCAPATVRSVLSRALRRLRDELADWRSVT